MRKTYRKLQFLSNIATVLIAILLSIIVIKQFLTTTPEKPASLTSSEALKPTVKPNNQNIPPPITPVGKAVPIEGINWKDNKKTVVLYISTKCRFCAESGPFYRRLTKDYAKNVKFIAVLPQTVDEGKSYLKGLGADIDEVYNLQLTSIGVNATPTILLVDENGIVSDMWKGKLPSDKEKEVIDKFSS